MVQKFQQSGPDGARVGMFNQNCRRSNDNRDADKYKNLFSKENEKEK